MKLKNPFRTLNKFEITLWVVSLVVVTASFLIPAEKDYLTLIASLIGVTALIFVAKGLVIGQILCIVFAVFYGIISFAFQYYGEVITYLGMSAPMALMAVISWAKNPYKGTETVAVSRVNKKQIIIMTILAIGVTAVMYFVLWAFNTANLIISTISVTTSFVAVYLTYLRSPYYALGYCANDIILIILWVLASIEDPANIPMIACFVMFLINDLYGFINWKRMEKSQGENK
ncbi:MAG: nicotinamide mononucleotide transporter [Clostridia bacterium]|nr:nicotinamide mononucleotide transporter [Clostridia bacterium]